VILKAMRIERNRYLHLFLLAVWRTWYSDQVP